VTNPNKGSSCADNRNSFEDTSFSSLATDPPQASIARSPRQNPRFPKRNPRFTHIHNDKQPKRRHRTSSNPDNGQSAASSSGIPFMRP
jgi:hypothetical protein